MTAVIKFYKAVSWRTVLSRTDKLSREATLSKLFLLPSEKGEQILFFQVDLFSDNISIPTAAQFF